MVNWEVENVLGKKNADLLYSEYLTTKVHEIEQNVERKEVPGQKFLSTLTILNIQISKCWL